MSPHPSRESDLTLLSFLPGFIPRRITAMTCVRDHGPRRERENRNDRYRPDPCGCVVAAEIKGAPGNEPDERGEANGEPDGRIQDRQPCSERTPIVVDHLQEPPEYVPNQGRKIGWMAKTIVACISRHCFGREFCATPAAYTAEPAAARHAAVPTAAPGGPASDPPAAPAAPGARPRCRVQAALVALPLAGPRLLSPRSRGGVTPPSRRLRRRARVPAGAASLVLTAGPAT